MELSEEQKVRAKQLADAVGSDPGKYFVDALESAFKKGTEEIGALVTNMEIKLRLGERYSQVGKCVEKVKAEIGVVKEAYRIWYEESGKDLVAGEKYRLETQFVRQVDKLETLLAQLKNNADDIVEMFKKK